MTDETRGLRQGPPPRRESSADASESTADEPAVIGSNSIDSEATRRGSDVEKASERSQSQERKAPGASWHADQVHVIPKNNLPLVFAGEVPHGPTTHACRLTQQLARRHHDGHVPGSFGSDDRVNSERDDRAGALRLTGRLWLGTSRSFDSPLQVLTSHCADWHLILARGLCLLSAVRTLVRHPRPQASLLCRHLHLPARLGPLRWRAKHQLAHRLPCCPRYRWRLAHANVPDRTSCPLRLSCMSLTTPTGHLGYRAIGEARSVLIGRWLHMGLCWRHWSSDRWCIDDRAWVAVSARAFSTRWTMEADATQPDGAS